MHPINIIILNCAGFNKTDVKGFEGTLESEEIKRKIVSTFQKTPECSRLKSIFQL